MWVVSLSLDKVVNTFDYFLVFGEQRLKSTLSWFIWSFLIFFFFFVCADFNFLDFCFSKNHDDWRPQWCGAGFSVHPPPIPSVVLRSRGSPILRGHDWVPLWKIDIPFLKHLTHCVYILLHLSFLKRRTHRLNLTRYSYAPQPLNHNILVIVWLSMLCPSTSQLQHSAFSSIWKLWLGVLCPSTFQSQHSRFENFSNPVVVLIMASLACSRGEHCCLNHGFTCNREHQFLFCVCPGLEFLGLSVNWDFIF